MAYMKFLNYFLHYTVNTLPLNTVICVGVINADKLFNFADAGINNLVFSQFVFIKLIEAC